MAPGTRRANRGGYVEHDDFEGLPVRQWRQEWTSIAPPPQPELHQNDVWAIELLHGMPKDAVLLPPHTQELLRAARSGRLYKRPPPTEDDDADGDTVQPDKLDKKEDDAMSEGYHLRLWRQIPKNVEAPIISHLAKRRKNTVIIASRTVEEKVQGPTVTRATVRRIDAAGNPYTEEVTLAEGQQLEGEIISTRVEALPAAKAEASAPALTPARRRPPPPKRKAKAGPGRGKKKLKNMPAESKPAGTVVTRAGAPAIKPEAEPDMTLSQIRSVTPTHEGEVAEGDDDDDDDEGEEEGEEGEEGETEGDDTTHIENLNNTSLMNADTTTATIKGDGHDMTEADLTNEIEMEDSIMMADDTSLAVLSSPSQPLTLAPLHASPNAPLEGSPLKNVVVQSPIRTTVSLPPPIAADSEAAMDTMMHIDVDEPSAPPQPAEEETRPESPDERGLSLPPPDQVGNISSPGTDDGVKSHASHDGEEGHGQLGDSTHLAHHMPTVAEDIIQPEDSVSVSAPMVGSTAPSETGATSLDDFRAGPLSIAGDAPFPIEEETMVEVEAEGADEGADEGEGGAVAAAETMVESAVEPEGQDEMQIEAEPEVVVERVTEVVPEVVPEVIPEVVPDFEADAGAAVEAEAEAEAEPESAPEALGFEIEAEGQAEPKEEAQDEARNEVEVEIAEAGAHDGAHDQTMDEGESHLESVLTLALEKKEASPIEEEHNLLSSLLGELDRQDEEAVARQGAAEVVHREIERVEEADWEEEAVMTDLQAALITDAVADAEVAAQDDLPVDLKEEVKAEVEALPEAAEDETMAETEAPPVPTEAEAEVSEAIEPLAEGEVSVEVVDEPTSTEEVADVSAKT